MSTDPPPAPRPGPSEHVVDRHTRLVRRTALVSLLTLVSRVLGFVREVLAAILFGATSPIYDAFLTAWRVPNLFRRFFGEGALSTSLQTAMTEEDAERGDAAGRALFRSTLRVTTLILIGVCAAGMALCLFAPGLADSGLFGTQPGAAAVLELTVRMLPFLVLVCIAALCAGALQVRGEFVSTALAPVAMNVVWIVTLVCIALAYRGADPLTQARFLAGGVVLSGLAQLVVQFPALRRMGLVGAQPDGVPVGRASRGGLAVLAASAPFAVGAAAYQINVMIDGLMAEALLPDGGPTAHYLANRVQQFPLALIAIAATSAVFPSLKALGHLGRLDELRRLHDRTQYAILFLALPSAAGLAALAGPISSALFEHGAFDAAGAARVARALVLLALALPAAGAVGLTSRVYYARGDLRTPVRIAVVALAVNTALNYLFLRFVGLDVEGLALATAITIWGNWFALLPGLGRLGLPPAAAGGARHVGCIGAASAAAGLAALAARGATAGLDDGGGALTWLRLTLGVAAGAAAFALVARQLALPEWELVAERLRARRAGR